MRHIQFEISLTLQAPILTHTSGAVSFGLDAAMQRDTQGRPIFTGSLIRGNLRHAWEDLREITNQPTQQQIEYWLGKEAETANQQPERASLTFSEYWLDKAWNSEKQTGKRYRIAIDETTGAVKTGALQVIDSPYAVGETPTFTGIINAKINDDKTNDEIESLQHWLTCALQMIPAIGALKTNGFGKILNITVNDITKPADEKSQKPLDNLLLKQTQLGLRINPHSSFCFAKAAIGEDNHFEAETHIPAAALIAAIDNHIKDDPDSYKELNEHLSQLHVTHAKPVPKGIKKRPIALPLSMVEAGGKFHNIATNKTSKLMSEQAPTFLIDWKYKHFKKAQQKLNFAGKDQPDIQLKIRTAIERSTGAAKESQLFSMETISPQGFDWISNLNIENIPENDREKVLQQLHTLFQQPLTQLGKTKASININLESNHCYTTQELETKTGQVIIYLQSAARLLPSKFKTKGTNQGTQLHEAYQQAWGELSDHSLELSHFFAQQQLQGGEHWWKRNRKQQNAYHPELFTQAGSVFVFTIKDNSNAKAQKLIEQWQKQGLPQLKDSTEDWDDNPWIAANGYGEIAVNLNIEEGAKHEPA